MKYVCLGAIFTILTFANATFGQSDHGAHEHGDEPARDKLIPDPQPLFPSSQSSLFPELDTPLFRDSDPLFGPSHPLFDRPDPFYVAPEPPLPPPMTVLSDLGIDSQTIADALVGVNDTADPDAIFAELENLLNELLAQAPEPSDPSEDIMPRPRLFPMPDPLFRSSYDPLFVLFDPLPPGHNDPLFADAYRHLFPSSYDPLFPEFYDPLFRPYGPLIPIGDSGQTPETDLPDLPDIPTDIFPTWAYWKMRLLHFQTQIRSKYSCRWMRC
jgi:hypothetical protein